MEAFGKVKIFIEEKTIERIKEIYSRNYISSWGSNETQYFIDISKDAGIEFVPNEDYMDFNPRH